ncbi:MAG: triose-phosphate isomerase [Saprospiraceae bacterium]
MKRQQIAAGNWKMNKDYKEGRDLAKAIADGMTNSENLAILGVPATHLKAVSGIVKKVANLEVAAQNCHQAESGAYTGEISVSMIKSVGAKYVILGHSERRAYFNESHELLAAKVNTVLGKRLIPIFCCGEPLEIREADTHVAHVKKQLTDSLFHLKTKDFRKIVIAYEPIWAIGTGVTASPAQAQDMHKAIRSLIADRYSASVADETTILYGGSVKPANAKELFGQPDVDGGLVGGASLKAADFLQIIESF